MKKSIYLHMKIVLFLTVIFSISNETNLQYALSNGMFWTGLIYVIIGLAVIVDIIGLFKSFGYMIHRNKIRNINKNRLKDNLEPLPLPDMVDYLNQREHLPVSFLVTMLTIGIILWIFSFILSIL